MNRSERSAMKRQDPFRGYGQPVPVLTPQVRTMRKGCPNKCEPQFFLDMTPKPGAPSAPRNALARCLICLTYWEVDPQGNVVNVRGPKEEPQAEAEQPGKEQ